MESPQLRVADCTVGGDGVLRDILLSTASSGNYELILTRMPQIRAAAAMGKGEVDLIIEDVPYSDNIQGAYAVIPLLAAVHADNPVRGMSLEDVRKTFNGAVANWQMLNADAGDHAIIRFTTEDEHAGIAVLRHLVLNDEFRSNDVFRARTPVETLRMLGAVPGGLALVGVPGTEDPLPETTRFMSVDGVVPTEKSFLEGRYPLLMVRRLLVGPKAGPKAKRLMELLNSAQGRELLRAHGMVPYERTGEKK